MIRPGLCRTSSGLSFGPSKSPVQYQRAEISPELAPVPMLVVVSWSSLVFARKMSTSIGNHFSELHPNVSAPAGENVSLPKQGFAALFATRWPKGALKWPQHSSERHREPKRRGNCGQGRVRRVSGENPGTNLRLPCPGHRRLTPPHQAISLVVSLLQVTSSGAACEGREEITPRVHPH